MTRNRLLALKTVVAVCGISVASVALIGFAHTKTGRPLLSLLGSGSRAGACPLGYDNAQTPEERELNRRAFASTHAGVQAAKARPALGFELDRTTRDDVQSWAKANHVTCTPRKAGVDMDCENVPAALLPAHFDRVQVDSLWLNFGAEDRLISVVAIRHDKEASVVSEGFEQINEELTAESGLPTTIGHSSPAQLRSGLLQQATSEYRFHNYYALSRATNMGESFVLTEEYRSLPD